MIFCVKLKKSKISLMQTKIFHKKIHYTKNDVVRKNIPVIVCLCFIIWPLFSLPIILIEVYNRKRYAIYLLSFFMGLLAILWAPTGDLYRHNMSYFNYIGEKDFELGWSQFDFVLHYLSWMFANNGINFEIIRFLFVLTSYLCIDWIFFDLIKKYELPNKYYHLCFAILFFSVNYFNITFGLRYGFGCVIIGTGYYLIFHNNNKLGWLFALFSVFIHYSLVFVLLILILGKFVKPKTKIAYIGLLFFLIPSTFLIETIIGFLPIGDIAKGILTTYTSGYWSGEFLEERSLLYRIATFTWNIATYYALFCFYTSKIKARNDSMITLLVLLWCISSCSTELYSRITQVISIPLILWMVYNFARKQSPVSHLKILRTLLIFAFICNAYSMRFVIYESRYSKLFFYSSWNILTEKYDRTWINRNVNYDGSLSKYF